MEINIKLIAFDLDGTFLDHNKQIPPENMRALDEAAARGVHIVPATGRIYKGVPEAIKRLPYVRYYILSNGSMLYDAQEDRALARAEISAERAAEVLRYEDSRPVLYDCYQDGWGYMTSDMYDRAVELVTDPGILNLVKTLRTPVPELKKYLLDKNEGVQKLQVYFRDQEERRCQYEILPRMFPDMAVTSSVPFNLEINALNATKGNALKSLSALLGLSAENILAFGDGSNDADMIRFAGVGVAMANAVDELRAAADWVTSSNAEAGVARGIERFVLHVSPHCQVRAFLPEQECAQTIKSRTF